MAVLDNSVSRNGLEIAIIGMACRFPGADNVEAFWENLRSGVESITFFTEEELINAGVDRELLKHPGYVRARATMKEADKFDSELFGVHPREAEIMDPQHRVFLECAWEALESAGYDPKRYRGEIGVYAGAGKNSYLLNLFSNPDLIDTVGRFLTGISNEKDHLTTKVAYKLGLTGPVITVQTACSTSLVATCLACQGLLSGACDIALAGGVSVSIPEESGYLYQEGGIESPDGRCRAFDAKAGGCVGGNGAGVVVLKRLEDALADGDVIHAVIRGSAINNDGSLKVGYTAPGMDGQSRVISAALAMAEVNPETIGYVEAHGTGTPLGDPVEVAALTQAFRAHTDKKQFCAIGSVKTNIGHLDTAAGVAGLIKAVLCLKAGQIPPSLHFNSPNPQIDFENSPFYVNTQLSGWPLEGPRRAAVSSFGIGGTNAHVILEQAPPPPRATAAQPQDGRCFLLPLSAATPTALRQVALRLEQFLISQPDCRLADVAFTLQTGRRELAYRSYVVARTSAEAAAELRKPPGMRQAASRPLFFLFPGQGSQFVNCGRWLYSREGVFRQTLESCARLLEEDLGENICGLLMPEEGRKEEASRRLRQTRITQPALFALEYALARQLMAWGLKPAGLLGHSLGEIVAATLAGVMSLEDGLRLVSARGAAMQRRPAGAMLSVGIGASELEPELGPELSLAAINLPDACVASGPEREIERLEREMSSRGVMTKRLETSHGFHSWMMEGAAEEVREEARKLSLGGPRITVFSNVSGRRLREEEARSAEYWAEQMLRPVRFSECVGEMLKEEKAMVLEVGPGGGLWALVNRHPERKAEQIVARSMRRREEREEEEEEILKKALGEAWSGGQEVNWREMERGERGRRVTLPCYPFERKRYWVERSEADKSREAREKKREGEWYYAPVWKQSLRVERERREGERRRWMVMVDEEGIGERVSERLRREGEKVWVVRRGEEYRRAGEAEYEIRVESAEDYRRLWEELSERGETPSNILHMWTLGATENCYRDRCDAHEKYGFYSLLFLAQALGEYVLARSLGQETPQNRIEIAVISSQAQKVLSRDQICPEKTMALGPCRVIPLEYPGVTCRSVDIPDPGTFNSQDEALIEFLFGELTSNSDDVAIAYRGGDRWIQVYDPAPLRKQIGRPSLLKPGGAYLITGGLGGVGLALAEAIAGLVPAKIVLLGRSAFPERDQWDQWLNSHDERDEISRKIKKIIEIERQGAEVLALRADVSNEFEMSRVSEVIQSRFGRVCGVIHAAGVPPAGLMQLKTLEAAEEVLRPKIEGTRILSRLFKDSDFMILCSSLRALSPIPGMVDYCAANLFLDAFAQSRKASDGARIISINWDGWTEVGMGSNVVSRPAPERDQAIGLTSQEGIEAFKRLLWSQSPQILVSTSDLETALRTNNGLTALKALEELEKINATGSFYPRPQLFTKYEAPTNEVEKKLVEIWQNLLGIAPIGIHDNFFELGGDSILSLQIIAKANQAGLSLAPGKIFESQTIAELARSAGQGVTIVAEQEAVTGPVPLTPAQHWFFEQELPEQHHWNQAYLFEAREPLNPVWLEKAIEKLLFQHDALRLRFHRGASGWEQTISEPSGETPLVRIDLSHLSGDEQTAALTRECERLQASLDLSQGPIARFALFGLGHDRNERLLIVIHHLAVDALSWRVLLDDLHAAYRRLSRNEEVKLLPKTTSFKYWAERLNEYAHSDDLKAEIEYWTDPSFSQATPLPVDYYRGVNTVASMRDVTVSLDVDDTRNLLHEIPQICNAKVTEALLAALGRSLGRWAGSGKLLIGLESHGREPLFNDVELGRTVGWFTAFFPFLLDLESGADSVSALKLVKEQIRRVRNRGIGYGALRYLSGDLEIAGRLRALPEPEISFLYLGQQDQDAGGALTLRLARESFGSLRSPRGLRSALIDLTARVAGGQLRLTWSYSENIHRRASIEKLAQDYRDEIRSLIAQCLSSNAGFYAPSDFPEAAFSQSDLDDIMAELSEFDER